MADIKMDIFLVSFFINFFNHSPFLENFFIDRNHTNYHSVTCKRDERAREVLKLVVKST